MSQLVRHRFQNLAWACPLLLVALLAGGCQEQNVLVTPPPPAVTVDKPVVKEIRDSVIFTGTTRATATVDLRARVNGYLKRIGFEDGAMVQEGDVLFVIEPAPFEAALAAANANLAKAETALALGEANLARSDKLLSTNTIAQETYDIELAKRNTAIAEVEAAEAAVKQAKLDLSYTTINAPISGRIGRHLVDVGNLVQSEQTLLATIESIDPIHAYFSVSERDLLRFMTMARKQQIPNPETEPPVVYMGLSHENEFPHEGKLDYRELGVDPSTGTVMRRAVFPNPDSLLVPGLFVRVKAFLGEPKPRVLVEERAIGADQRGDFVLVVNDQNVVEYRHVTLGINVEGMRVIENGIAETDWVVVNGLQRARPGAEVNPQRAEAAATVTSHVVPETASIDSAPAE